MKKTNVGITTTIEPDLRSYRDKWPTKKQYETFKAVQQRFQDMQEHREQSCPWPVPEEEVAGNQRGDNSAGAGDYNTDWGLHWRRNEKNLFMRTPFIKDRPTVKLPLSFSPTQAALAEFMETTPGVVMQAEDNDDDTNVRLIYERIRHTENKYNLDMVDAESFYMTVIYGTSFTYNCWTREERSVEMLLSGNERDEFIKGNIEEAAQKLVEEKKPLTKQEVLVEHNDINKIAISPFDIYVDPDATSLRGGYREASDLFWLQYPSVENLKAMMEASKDPYIIKANIKKVRSAKSAYEAYEGGEPMFNYPSDFDNTSQRVVLFKYYNKRTDKYIIIANDVVLRDGPIPYNHKQLPFSIHKYGMLPNMLYGVGIPTMLEHPQLEAEVLHNMQIRTAQLNASRPMIVHTDVYPRLTEQMGEVEPGQVLESPELIGPQNLQFFPAAPATMDLMQVMGRIESDVTKATGINSLMYSVPQGNQPVRNNLMTQESSQRIMKIGFKMWAQGKVETYRQWVSLLMQYDPESSEVDEKGAEKYRKIKIEGFKVVENEAGEREIEQVVGSSNFEMTPDIYQLNGDVGINLDFDTILPTNKSVRVQNMDRAIQRYVPLVMSPEVMANPIVVELLREDMKVNGISQEVINMLQNEGGEEEALEALAENQMMEQGQELPGMPGRSEQHKNVHAYRLLELNVERNQVRDAIMEVAPQIQQSMQEPPQEVLDMIEREQEIQSIIDRIMQHLMVDNAPKDATDDVAMQVSQPPAPPQPEGGMPQGDMPPEQAMVQAVGPEQAGQMPVM